MLKIFIITQNEPFYIPKMIRYILENQNNHFSIQGFTVLPPTRKNKNLFHWYKERSRIYNFKELFIVGGLFFYAKVHNILSYRTKVYSVRGAFQKAAINEYKTDDINSGRFIKILKSLSVDIIVSISCPQLFKEALLETPKFCLNAHGTLLPRHRGVFGSWWTLFSEDQEAGSTIHTMELRLDAGKIMWQKPFSITDKDTQYSIAYKTKNDMAKGLVNVFQQINSNNINNLNPIYNSSYHRAPTKKEGNSFHKKGKHIIKLKDVRNIIKKNFD